MESQLIVNSGFYMWIVLPFLIFLARVLDVSLGTVRVIFVSRGFKYLSPLIGFFEILIWLLAIGQIMKIFPILPATLLMQAALRWAIMLEFG